MRLFVALDIPDDVRGELAERLDVVRQLRPDLRWVRPENYHLTVRFLGECGQREADRQLGHWAERAATVSPFDIALEGAGCFPHPWMAKVLYAGVRLDEQQWARLAGPDQTPHITVARSRERAELTGALLELDGLSSQPWRADGVVVYRSSLARGRPPQYEALEFLSFSG